MMFISSIVMNPRCIDIDLVNAQQARRILDRLVGYKLSPFLAQKIRKGLSAGRVQSVAVRIIVDREEQIRAFKPEEYWTIDAKFIPKGERKAFPASLYDNIEGTLRIKDKNSSIKLDIRNEEKANQILAELENESFKVGKVKNGRRTRKPAPPFITSTLQQECSRKLGFQSKRTMRIAQELYEGVDGSRLVAASDFYSRNPLISLMRDKIILQLQLIMPGSVSMTLCRKYSISSPDEATACT